HCMFRRDHAPARRLSRPSPPAAARPLPPGRHLRSTPAQPQAPRCLRRRSPRMEPVFIAGSRPMPSFDVVSEVDKHELTNAIDQANRELSTRFDFKGVDAKYVLEDEKLI